MGALRLVIVLVVAAASALGLALVVRQMTASRAAVAMAATPKERAAVRVLVAKRDLKVGERLKAEDVAWQAWPANAVNPAFVSGGPVDPRATLADKAQAALQSVASGDAAVQALAGSLVREPILANEPMNQRKLVKAGQAGFMAVKLPTGMRAMSTPVTMETGVAGFILPGDHVDVIEDIKLANSSQQSGGPAQPIQSKTLLTNITVLAIDQTPDPKPGAASLVGATATLEVPAEDIEILAKAREEGSLQLALRSYEDMQGPQGVIAAPTAAARPARLIPVRTEAAAVRVYRGVKVSEEKVP
jgi:pilus assembly protein CpaB